MLMPKVTTELLFIKLDFRAESEVNSYQVEEMMMADEPEREYVPEDGSTLTTTLEAYEPALPLS